jgi:hypothetical protein
MAAPVAPTEAINWLTAFWVPFGAAALGGLLSAVGAVVAIAWQSREQRTARDRAAVDLFSHLLREQGRYLSKIGDYRAAQSGQFSFIDADKMQAVFQAFERNREWLVWIKDEALRSRIADQLSDNHIWVTIIRNLATEQQQAGIALTSLASGTAEWQVANQRNQDAATAINNLFSDVNRLRDNTLGLASELGSKV